MADYLSRPRATKSEVLKHNLNQFDQKAFPLHILNGLTFIFEFSTLQCCVDFGIHYHLPLALPQALATSPLASRTSFHCHPVSDDFEGT